VWDGPAAAASAWTEEASYSPAMPPDLVAAGLATWHRAVERARDWARD
jgi:glycerol kinase